MGLAEKLVPIFMGHSSTQVTEKYLHAADKQLAAQVNSIEWSADLAIA